MISKEQVKHIAKLARLSLSEKEVEKFQKQLGDILDYIKILDELNVEKEKPTSHVTGLINVFREDEIAEHTFHEQALSGTNSKEKGCFKVKKILKK